MKKLSPSLMRAIKLIDHQFYPQAPMKQPHQQTNQPPKNNNPLKNLQRQLKIKKNLISKKQTNLM